MTHIGPLDDVPIACTLTPAAGRAQIRAWQVFDEEYALHSERTDTRSTIHYVKLEDSIRRLRELVAVESTCCAFVDWTIDLTGSDLRLVITGTPDELAALDIAPVED